MAQGIPSISTSTLWAPQCQRCGSDTRYLVDDWGRQTWAKNKMDVCAKCFLPRMPTERWIECPGIDRHCGGCGPSPSPANQDWRISQSESKLPVIRMCRSGHWCTTKYCGTCGLNVKHPHKKLLPWPATPGILVYRWIWPNRLPPQSPEWLKQATEYVVDPSARTAGEFLAEFKPKHSIISNYHTRGSPQDQLHEQCTQWLAYMQQWANPFTGFMSCITKPPCAAIQIIPTVTGEELPKYQGWYGRLNSHNTQLWKDLIECARSLSRVCFSAIRHQLLHDRHAVQQELLVHYTPLVQKVINFVRQSLPVIPVYPGGRHPEDYLARPLCLDAVEATLQKAERELDILGQMVLPDFRHEPEPGDFAPGNRFL